jgi:hypothetical protein
MLVDLTNKMGDTWRGVETSTRTGERDQHVTLHVQAVSHPAVIGSPTGRRTISPLSSRFGRGRPSL